MRTSNDTVLRRAWSGLTAALMLMLAPVASAEISVAILDFELNDITGLRAPEEQRRTASLAPLLRDAMSQMNGYDLTAIEPDAQVRANAGVGYLFNQPEAAAALAEASGAKWVVAGMLQKSSYLFAYVTVRVSNVTTKQLIGEFNTRLEGPMTDDRLTRRGMQRIAAQVDAAIEVGLRSGGQSKNSRSTEG
jgi:Protein of unknown function (DUF2380)